MKKLPISNLVLVSLALFVAGCGNFIDKNVLAAINNKEKITLKEFNAAISKLPERYQEIAKKNKSALLDEIIINKLLYKEAMRRHLDRNKEVKDMMEDARKKALVFKLLEQEVEKASSVNEQELENYYTANRDKFMVPETLRASHILVKTEDEAKQVWAELSKGRAFEELAKTYSMDPTAKIGGDIGYFTRNQLVPEFEDVCFNMKVGETSGIVKTKFGYHIIKLTERKEPAIKEFLEVRPLIEETIKRAKNRARFNEFVENLKKKSKITINASLLESISEETPSESPKE